MRAGLEIGLGGGCEAVPHVHVCGCEAVPHVCMCGQQLVVQYTTLLADVLTSCLAAPGPDELVDVLEKTPEQVIGETWTLFDLIDEDPGT